MKKKFFVAVFILLAGNAVAQTTTAVAVDTSYWKKTGLVSVTFNQSAFNKEWTGGGIGNMNANVLVNYNFNYQKGAYIWDNKVIADYGVSKINGTDSFVKNNDRLEMNSLVGKRSSEFWYYSSYANLKTQMSMSGDGRSHFFSPAYIQFGLGALWKKSENTHINIAPFASKTTLVNGRYTATEDPDAFDAAGGYFGVKANKTVRFELGASVKAYYKINLMKNVTMENLLGLYTNYLEAPKNIDIDYTMNLVLVANKYISANIVFQAIYDDNANSNGFQVREAFGLGIRAAF